MSIMNELRERIDEFLWEADWLMNFTGHEDPKIRLWAFDRLSYCYPERAVQVARDRIADEDVFLRQTATSHLGSHGDASDARLLKDRYDEATPAWKGTILNALAELGDEELIAFGEELLSEESVNINLVLSYVEALQKLDTEKAADSAREVYEKTRTEAVFSSLTGYFLDRASPSDLGDLSELVLRKLSDNVMLKVRHFCSRVREALFLFSPPVALPKIVEETSSVEEVLESFASSMNIETSLFSDQPEVGEAIREYREGNVVDTIQRLGEWGDRIAGTLSDRDSLRKRQVACFLSGLSDPPNGLEEVEVPGRPLDRLAQLALNCRVHFDETPHPVEELDEARDGDGFPTDLYRRESPFLVDEIALLCSRRDVDTDRLLSDAASEDAFFRRVKALKILALQEEEAVIPELINVLNSSNKLLYRTGARALVKFGPGALDSLDEAIREQTLDDGLVTAADVLRRIPTERSADVFLTHFDRFVAVSGVDPVVSFAADLAVPETADKLRACLDRNLLMVGEQLGIVCELYDLDFPEEERIQEKMEERSAQNQGGPHTAGSPFPGGGGPPMPGSGPDLPDDPSIPS